MHVPVLAGSALVWLRVKEGGVYVDCTAGGGGHSALIASRLSGGGRLVSLDRDESAVAATRERLQGRPNVTVVHANYGKLKTVLSGLGIERADGVLIDAGMSSMQLEDPRRGFSFQSEGPLDMRMDRSGGSTAAEFLSSVSESELAEVLRRYGDVPRAKRIASGIHERVQAGRLETTADLAEAVSESLGVSGRNAEEVRTVFQAIRMAVNEELRWLESGVREAIEVLSPGGRLVAISFHSGEDRVVKNVMREASREHKALHGDGRVREVVPASVKVLTRTPVRPLPEEVRLNPRSASARLRAVERIGDQKEEA